MKINWSKLMDYLDRNFLWFLLVIAVLAVIWAMIRPNPGTSLWW